MNFTKKMALGLSTLSLLLALPALAEDKSRFYDFSDQNIDGQIKKPIVMNIETRQRAKFDKLLKLKKSFRMALVDTGRERTLK